MGIGDIKTPVQENILEEIEDEDMNSNNEEEDELLEGHNNAEEEKEQPM